MVCVWLLPVQFIHFYGIRYIFVYSLLKYTVKGICTRLVFFFFFFGGVLLPWYVISWTYLTRKKIMKYEKVLSDCRHSTTYIPSWNLRRCRSPECGSSINGKLFEVHRCGAGVSMLAFHVAGPRAPMT